MRQNQITILAVSMIILASVTPVRATICDDLLRTNQMDAALECYLKALDNNPTDPAINLHICQILESKGQVDQLEPYLSKLNRNSKDASAFIEMLGVNYKTLQISCDGNSGCRRYFRAGIGITFIPPEDLEAAKASRLAAIQKQLGEGNLWFYPSQGGKSVSSIENFPVITGVPLPYSAQVKSGEREFTFNFIECSGLNLSITDLDSIRCGVPDTLAQLQIEIDDPDYEVFLRNTTGDKLVNIDDDKYYLSRGENSEIMFQRKGIPLLNRKYLLITSLVLTSALILFQR
ncbi:MAG TPA: hypothetical protein DEO84_08425 [candidate division Zixibacteria bacterium]|nr:hypothetical protein [candidate division Zixibacteria bacterium]HBZ01326.1 hypothetical protein [candidate division Zixibacteria bacterium]